MSFRLSYTKITKFQAIHYTIKSDVEENMSNTMERLISENNDTPILPFNTVVVATIRIKNNDPIWSKQYPYPMSCTAFVNIEIEQLLRDGIIKPRHSPYNAPVWVVPKKDLGADETPKQL